MLPLDEAGRPAVQAGFTRRQSYRCAGDLAAAVAADRRRTDDEGGLPHAVVARGGRGRPRPHRESDAARHRARRDLMAQLGTRHASRGMQWLST
jgi:hypothetical protein